MTLFATSNAGRIIGRVKWFNNNAGYGFISITDGPRSGTDIFIHHSAISVLHEQYKYLVQGEYVEFSLGLSQIGTHEFNAVNVSGINGGTLMCETRLEHKKCISNATVSEQFGAAFDDIASKNDIYKFQRPPPIHISPRHNRYFSDDCIDQTER